MLSFLNIKERFKMSKLSVKQYSVLNGVSVQTVYKHIRKGLLETTEVDGIKYIIIQDSIDFEKMYNDIKLKHESTLELWQTKNELIESLKLQIDSLNQQIKLFTLLLPTPKYSTSNWFNDNKDEFIDVKEKVKKKKKEKLSKKEKKKLKKKRRKKEKDIVV